MIQFKWNFPQRRDFNDNNGKKWKKGKDYQKAIQKLLFTFKVKKSDKTGTEKR